MVNGGITVEVGGAALPQAIGRSLTALLVRQALGVPAVAELDFLQPVAALAETLLRLDAPLRLAVGTTLLFAGTVVALEWRHPGDAAPVLRLRAYDALHGARRRRRTRALADHSPTDLARELAASIGLEAAPMEPTTPRPLVIQRGESDLEALRSLAEPVGLYPVVRGEELHLLALDGDRRPPVPLRLGANLRSVTLRQGTEVALRRAQVQAWDAATLQCFAEEAGQARQDALDLRGGLLPEGQGAALFGGRQATDAAEARAIAQAAMDRAAAAETTAEGVSDGDAAIVPGRILQLAGVTPALEGLYVATAVVHRIDAAGGFTTAFETAPPPPAPRTPAPFLALATITDIADPEEMGRCRASLDNFDAVVTGWMPVLVPGAGTGKGLVAFPDPGDRVLLALPEGDMARGIILGSLYGDQALPRGLGGAQRAFVLRSGAGLASLELGGRSATARLTTAGGSLLEMEPAQLRLAAASDLLIEAPGRVVTIRGRAIRFEEG
jgi:uncharacterized protein involved in type VI secretion and phage assembly